MSPKALVSNTLAGVLIGIINITVAISVAALMFTGTNPDYFAVGVTILLVGTLVTALGGTLFSGFHGVIVAPRSGLAPVFAGLVASVAALMAARGSDGDILATIIMTVMVTTMAAGLFLVLLGQLKLGSLVRYIPYPVMGGFFAGIGYIFVRGGIAVASGAAPSLANLEAFLGGPALQLTTPAAVFAVALYWTQRQWGHWTVFPLFLAAGFAAFYAALAFTGMSREEAAALGWLPVVSATASGIPVFLPSSLPAVDWSVVAAQMGSIATVALLCAIILLLDISGIEIIAKRELSPDRELKVAGLTSVVNGLAGGYPGVHAASDTAFTYKLGGDGRLMGLIYAGVVIVAISAGTGFLGIIPTFILGGLLIYLGIDFLVDWVWTTRKTLPLADYLVVLLILAVIAAVGILEGVAFGFAVAVVMFVVTYSRLSIVRSEVRGDEHTSHVDRDPDSRALLNIEGRHILIMKLQNFIFFGTADRLLAAIKERVANRRPDDAVRYLVLDFRHVSQLDTSAVQAFSKLAQLSDTKGVHLAVTEMSAEARARLESFGFFTDPGAETQRRDFAQLDDGVAWCEQLILEKAEQNRSALSDSLEARLVQYVGGGEAAASLAPYFEPVEMTAGDYLFRQGDEGDGLYLIHSGTAAVVIPLAGVNGEERVLRIFQPGAIVGEMALYTHAPRSAGVRVEEGGTFFRLTPGNMERLQKENPGAAGLFHAAVVRLLAGRLDRANRELQRHA